MSNQYTKEDYADWPYVEEPLRFESNGKAASQALFYEHLAPTVKERYGYDYTKFSMKTKEYKGFPSAYQIIHYADSEYDAAMKICGCLQIWDTLRNSDLIEYGRESVCVGVSDAMEAQERRIEAEQIRNLTQAAREGNVSAMKELKLIRNKQGKKKKPLKTKKDNISPIDKLYEKTVGRG